MKKIKAIVLVLGLVLVSTFGFTSGKPVSQISTTKMENAVAKAAFSAINYVDGTASGPYINWIIGLDSSVTTDTGYGVRVYYYNNALQTSTTMVILSGTIPAGYNYATPQSLGGFNYYGVEHYVVFVFG